MSWLKAVAPRNMLSMSVTAETSHPEMSWLKEEAPRNMLPMSVTAKTSQVEMSPLKEEALLNTPSHCLNCRDIPDGQVAVK